MLEFFFLTGDEIENNEDIELIALDSRLLLGNCTLIFATVSHLGEAASVKPTVAISAAISN